MRENHPSGRRLLASIAAICTLGSLAIVPAANAQDTPDTPAPQTSSTQTQAAAGTDWQKAIDDADEGDTITLTGNVSENLTVKKKLTITAAPGAVYSGKLQLNSGARGSTVKGITFNRPEVTPDATSRKQINSLQLQSVSDVTVEGNTFNSPSALYKGFEWQVNAVAVFANVENITIKGNTFNLGRLNDTNAKGDQAQDVNSNVGVNLIGYSDGSWLKNVTIEGNTVNATKPAKEATRPAGIQFLIAMSGSSTITVKNNTFDGAADSGRAEFAGVSGAKQVDYIGNTVKNANLGMYQVKYQGGTTNSTDAKFKGNTFKNVSSPILDFSDFKAVNSDTGDTYAELSDAFAANANVTLIDNIDDAITLNDGQTSVVDLWYSKVYKTITNNGNLTIKREGHGDPNLETGAVVTEGPAIVNKAGTTTIESGQFKSTDGYALKAEAGTINVTGGFFSSKEQAVSDRSAKGAVSISGGRFNVKPTDQELAKGYVAVQDGNEDYPAYPWTVERQDAATATVNGKIAINPGVFHANEQFMFYVEKVQDDVQLPSFEQNGVKYDSKTGVATLTLDENAEWTTDDYPVTLNFANVSAGWYEFKVTAAGVSGHEDAQNVSAVEGKNSATVRVIVQDGQAHVSYFDAANNPTDQLNFAYTWTKPAPVQHTVRFHVNLADSPYEDPWSVQSVDAGRFATQPVAPKVDGFTFAGWFTDKEGTKPYDFEKTPVDADLDLYAKWAPDAVARYTVTFHSNGGSEVAAQEVAEGAFASKPQDPTRKGYTFAGWYTDNDTFEKGYDFTGAVVSSDVDLYAKWLPDESGKHWVSFVLNEGTPQYESQHVNDGEKAQNPGTPSRSGYKFLGWYYWSKKDGKNVKYDFNQPVHENLSLWANWEKIPETVYHDVWFDSNGGTAVSPNPQHLKDGAKATEPKAPTREGFKFLGWYYWPSNGDGNVLYDFAQPVHETLHLWAKWEKVGQPAAQTVKLFYKSNFGSGETYQVEGLKGSRFTVADTSVFNATPDGYTFKGWNTKRDGTGKWYQPAQKVKLDKDLTLYASWQKNAPVNPNPTPSPKPEPAPNPSPSLTDVVRFYNKGTGEHFYTADPVEQNVLRSKGVWRDEGVAFRMSSDKGAPVYRLYKSGRKHLFTTSKTERDTLLGKGWRYEGVAFYVPEGASVPVYRLYNPGNGDHLLTTVANERGVLVMHKWRDEGVVFNSAK